MLSTIRVCVIGWQNTSSTAAYKNWFEICVSVDAFFFFVCVVRFYSCFKFLVGDFPESEFRIGEENLSYINITESIVRGESRA